MNKKHSSQAQSIKKKLMAATSMLLVATIMLVSSTYAWFTLSTAPEVTGITTTVGANGSLEIALADATTWTDPNTLVTSGVGDSTATTGQTLEKANITWGNLVDLSPESYGLSQIKLLPAALNVAADGNVALTAPLSTPNYGTDGRVIDLAANTSVGVYNETKFEATTDGYGVRAIGTSSGMTERQLAYKNARNAADSYRKNASAQAKKSLEDNGNVLAEIVIAKFIGGTDSVTSTQKAALGNMLSGLRQSLNSINTSFDQALLAQAASAASEGTIDDTKFAIVAPYIGKNIHATDAVDGVLSKTVTIPATDTTEEQSITVSLTLDAYLTKAIAMYKATEATLSKAETDFNALGTKDTYTWDEISSVVMPLLNTDGVSVNGVTADRLTSDRDAAIDEVVNSIAGGAGVQVQLPSGAGLFANIADIAGTYSASITVSKVSYGSINLSNIPATMSTVHADTTSSADIGATAKADKAYLEKLVTSIDAMGAPTSEGGGDAGITDTYGYILDFYFRTNAANSNLLLETEGAQRIYTNSGNEATLGGGSYMQFSAIDPDVFSEANVASLMNAIRVVFMDSETGAVLKKAMLDMSATETDATTGGLKAPLKLYTETINTTTGDDGTETTTTTQNFVSTDNAVISGLTQNTAKKISVLVYLDGNYVSNGDVANAQTSMTGTLNLQFASDQDLIPMENSALLGSAGTETPDGE